MEDLPSLLWDSEWKSSRRILKTLWSVAMMLEITPMIMIFI